MGTRADFYVGRGEQAEWLGSYGLDGYPEGISDDILLAKSERDFRAAVAKHLMGRAGTAPDQGWPWPWENSRLTDYAYAWDGVAVFISHYGGPWHKPGEKCPTSPAEDDDWATAPPPCTDERRVRFPDMTARKNVTLGPRSGLIVLQGPKP